MKIKNPETEHLAVEIAKLIDAGCMAAANARYRDVTQPMVLWEALAFRERLAELSTELKP